LPLRIKSNSPRLNTATEAAGSEVASAMDDFIMPP
jgi:hypothetical protein